MAKKKKSGLTNDGRKLMWHRSFFVNLLSAAGSFVGFVVGQIDAGSFHVYFSLVVDDLGDRSAVFRTLRDAFLATAFVSMWGAGLGYSLSTLGGVPGGGRLKLHALLYAAVALPLAAALGSSAIVNIQLVYTVDFKSVTSVRTAMSRYPLSDETQNAFRQLHSDLSCCGSERYAEWFDIPWTTEWAVTTNQRAAVPDSCCDYGRGLNATCSVLKHQFTTITAYTTGCSQAISQNFRSALMQLTLFEIPLAVVQLWMTYSTLVTLYSGDLDAELNEDSLFLPPHPDDPAVPQRETETAATDGPNEWNAMLPTTQDQATTNYGAYDINAAAAAAGQTVMPQAGAGYGAYGGYAGYPGGQQPGFFQPQQTSIGYGY